MLHHDVSRELLWNIGHTVRESASLSVRNSPPSPVNATTKWVVTFLSIMTPVPINVMNDAIKTLLRMSDQELGMSHLKACNQLTIISSLPL
jgi:hypothetical protein